MGKAEEPFLGPFDQYIYDYFELSSCRGVNGGPIPFTSIAEFAMIKEIEDFEEFHYLIRVMDKVFCEHQEKHGDSSKNHSGNK